MDLTTDQFIHGTYSACLEVNAQFLMTELQLANTLLDTAAISGWPKHVEKCRQLATKVQTTVTEYLGFVPLADCDRRKICCRLAELADRIEASSLTAIPPQKALQTAS